MRLRLEYMITCLTCVNFMKTHAYYFDSLLMIDCMFPMICLWYLHYIGTWFQLIRIGKTLRNMWNYGKEAVVTDYSLSITGYQKKKKRLFLLVWKGVTDYSLLVTDYYSWKWGKCKSMSTCNRLHILCNRLLFWEVSQIWDRTGM